MLGSLSLSWQQRCQGFIFIFGFHIHNLNQSIKVITTVINQSGNQVNQSLALAFGYEECPWIALYSIGYEAPSCLPLLFAFYAPLLSNDDDAMF